MGKTVKAVGEQLTLPEARTWGGRRANAEESRGLRARKDRQGLKGPRDLKVRWPVNQPPSERLDLKGLRGLKATKDLRAPLDLSGPREPKGLLAPLARRGQAARNVRRAQRALLRSS